MTLLARIEKALEARIANNDNNSNPYDATSLLENRGLHYAIEAIRHVFAQPPTDEAVDIIARAIHEAKIRSCWPKAMWNREPWEKANSAVPDQPWHDIARDQARAAITADRGK